MGAGAKMNPNRVMPKRAVLDAEGWHVRLAFEASNQASRQASREAQGAYLGSSAMIVEKHLFQGDVKDVDCPYALIHWAHKHPHT
eukprot:1012150-Pelagomonas_calceolata.AAC.10